MSKMEKRRDKQYENDTTTAPTTESTRKAATTTKHSQRPKK